VQKKQAAATFFTPRTGTPATAAGSAAAAASSMID
jgi:hypothetical protein